MPSSSRSTASLGLKRAASAPDILRLFQHLSHHLDVCCGVAMRGRDLQHAEATPGWLEGPRPIAVASLQVSVERREAIWVCAPGPGWSPSLLRRPAARGASLQSASSVSRACRQRVGASHGERRLARSAAPSVLLRDRSEWARSVPCAPCRAGGPAIVGDPTGDRQHSRRWLQKRALRCAPGKAKAPDRAGRAAFVYRRIDQSIDLVSGQMMRDFDVRSFNRDGENALGDSQRRGVVRRHMMEKGSDRRQARVSRLTLVLALHFKLVQESKNEVSIEIRDAQCRWLTPGSFGDE